MKIVRKANAIFDGIVSLTGGIGGFIIIYLMLSVCTAVVFRYFLHNSLPWVLRIAEASLVYFTFLITAWILRREAHVRMDLLLTRLKPRIQALVNLITSLIGAIIFLIIVWYSSQVTWELAVSGFYQQSSLQIPDAYIIFVIPLGCFLLSMQFLRRAYRNLMLWRGTTQSEEQAA